jgi:hypothetical protein
MVYKYDLYGFKLRLLYYNCRDVKGCYIRLHGSRVYALMSNREAPDLACIVSDRIYILYT